MQLVRVLSSLFYLEAGYSEFCLWVLGAFAIQSCRNTLSASPYPSICVHVTRETLNEFYEIRYWGVKIIFIDICQFFVRSDNYGHFIWKRTCVSDCGESPHGEVPCGESPAVEFLDHTNVEFFWMRQGCYFQLTLPNLFSASTLTAAWCKLFRSLFWQY
jgi:hypothetical protein